MKNLILALTTYFNKLNINFNQNDFNTWFEQNLSIFSLFPKNIYITKENNTLFIYGFNEDSTDYIISIYETSDFFKKININKFPNVKSEGFIQEYKNIPKLYWIKSDYINFNNINKNPLSKESSKYDWLLQLITEKFSKNSDKKPFELLEMFIENNKSNLDKLSNIFEYSPKLLGAGDEGFAYDIGKGFVLKIFNSTKSYEQYKNQIKSLHENNFMAPTETMVYDVGILGNINGKNLYYVILEKMIPVKEIDKINKNLDSKYFQNIIYYINNSIIGEFKDDLNFREKILNYLNTNKLDDNLINSIKILSEKIKNDVCETFNCDEINKQLNLNKNWIQKYCEEVIYKIMSRRNDLHIGNLGIDNSGILKFFDSYHQDLEDEDIFNTNLRTISLM